jgi:hypothetical protein
MCNLVYEQLCIKCWVLGRQIFNLVVFVVVWMLLVGTYLLKLVYDDRFCVV